MSWLNNPMYGEAGIDEANRRRQETELEGLARSDRRTSTAGWWRGALGAPQRLVAAVWAHRRRVHQPRVGGALD